MNRDERNPWWRLVRFGFRLLYNEMAFTYDAVSWFVSLGSWRCWQRSVFPHLPDPQAGIILELAHGTGNLQIDLYNAGYDTIGYDLSVAMGRIASRKLSKNDFTPSFVRGRAEVLPFPAESFPAIVSTFPTDFIVDSKTLREAHRVLKSDGKLIVVLNGVFTRKSVVRRFLEWLYYVTGQRDESDRDFDDYFGGYGFRVRPITASCPHSQAQLVILTK